MGSMNSHEPLSRRGYRGMVRHRKDLMHSVGWKMKGATWEHFSVICATNIPRNIFYTYNLESVPRKSKLRDHLCLLFHKGITCRNPALKWVKWKLCMVKINFKKFLEKLEIDILCYNTLQLCGISLPQGIWSCFVVHTADEEVGLYLGNILYQKYYL